MSDMTDAECVVAAQEGDEEAFRVLVERHYGTVHGLAFSTVRDVCAAEDLTQDVFLIAWTNRARLRRPGAFLMWLFAISLRGLPWVRWRRRLGRLSQVRGWGCGFTT